MKVTSRMVKFKKEKKRPSLFREIAILEKDADKVLENGFGAMVLDVRRIGTPQKGDVLNFNVFEGGICSYSVPYHELHDLGAVVLDVQAGVSGLEPGYVLITFALGDESLKVDDDINSSSNNKTENK